MCIGKEQQNKLVSDGFNERNHKISLNVGVNKTKRRYLEKAFLYRLSEVMLT